MRLARIADGQTIRAGIVDGERLQVVQTDPGDPDPLLTMLRDDRGLAEAASASPTGATLPLSDVELLSPLRRPGKIVAVGLNYRDHTAETGLQPPARPLTFAKYPSSLTGARSEIVLPGPETQQVDYEAELAIVVGRECPPDGAAGLRDVAAYAVANDVSARDVQFADQQWTRGKSFDTFTPFGPWLVTADEVPEPHTLAIRTCVNGEVVQDDTTASMIFDIPALLAHINTGVRLEPGDVVLTGTPAGAGAFRTPPRYLAEGDVVEVAIESIGTLRNPVVDRENVSKGPSHGLR